MHGTSSMKADQLLTGRPYGGTAILWKHKLTSSITPIELSSNRVCAMLIKLGQLKLLLFNVYMPYGNAPDSEESIEEVLAKVLSCCNSVENNWVIIGGDFNTDFR